MLGKTRRISSCKSTSTLCRLMWAAASAEASQEIGLLLPQFYVLPCLHALFIGAPKTRNANLICIQRPWLRRRSSGIRQPPDFAAAPDTRRPCCGSKGANTDSTRALLVF